MSFLGPRIFWLFCLAAGVPYLYRANEHIVISMKKLYKKFICCLLVFLGTGYEYQGCDDGTGTFVKVTLFLFKSDMKKNITETYLCVNG